MKVLETYYIRYRNNPKFMGDGDCETWLMKLEFLDCFPQRLREYSRIPSSKGWGQPSYWTDFHAWATDALADENILCWVDKVLTEEEVALELI